MQINDDLIIENTSTKLSDLTTDYIVERGSQYIKYNSGIIIQWGSYTYKGSRTYTWKNFYLTNAINEIYFPIKMNSLISSSLTAYANTGEGCILITNTPPNGTKFGSVYAGSDVSASSTTMFFHYIVIGTWK
jgi:hypothetical protein